MAWCVPSCSRDRMPLLWKIKICASPQATGLRYLGEMVLASQSTWTFIEWSFFSIDESIFIHEWLLQTHMGTISCTNHTRNPSNLIQFPFNHILLHIIIWKCILMYLPVREVIAANKAGIVLKLWEEKPIPDLIVWVLGIFMTVLCMISMQNFKCYWKAYFYIQFQVAIITNSFVDEWVSVLFLLACFKFLWY